MVNKKKKKTARKQAPRTKAGKAKAARTNAARKPLRKKAKAAKARKPARTAKPKAVKKARTVKMARKATARVTRAKAPAKKVIARAPARKPVPARKAPAKAPAAPPVAHRPAVVKTPARLQRERRRLPEAEEETFTEVSEDSRLMSSARAGHDELRSEMRKHTESSPALTAGDVDAKWQDAYALGDEAPGGDNMTPDQDRVDDIGKALGIEYADDEELRGGDELTERDEHRWELDPASKDEDDDL